METIMAKRKAVGKIKTARRCSKPKNINGGLKGMKYEHKCHVFISYLFKDMIEKDQLQMFRSDWIHWIDVKGKHCGSEADAVIFDHENKIVNVFEVKAWNYAAGISELKTLYMPLYKHMFPEYQIKGFLINGTKGKALELLSLDDVIDGEIKSYRYPTR